MHILTKKMLKLDFFGKNDTKTVRSIAKIVKIELVLEVSGDHPIPVRSLDFVE